MKRKTYYSKRCPRCGTKNDYTSAKCSQCGLIFSRVENGSNKLAKGLILSRQGNFTIKAPGFPKDVSKKTFMLLCGFLGFFGGHNFYVGRFIKATFQLVIGLFSIVMSSLSGYVPALDIVMSFMFFPVAINAFMWMFDLIDGALNKYKIPVAVDFSDGKVQEKPKKEKKSKKQESTGEQSNEKQNEQNAEEVKAEDTDMKN